MRSLGIDYGTARIGIAMSDPLGLIAQPLEFIPARPIENVWKRLTELQSRHAVALVVVGLPRNMNGSEGPATQQVKAFVDQLKLHLPIAIRTWDERLTTVQAQRLLRQANVRKQKRRQRVDQIAAAILLQSYLDWTASSAEPLP